MQKTSNSPEQTIQLGKKIAAKLKGGDIVLLHGDLGAGKTTLVKGIALGLGIRDEILSPTFTLMNVYGIKTLKQKNIKTLVHIDTYRLENEKQLIEIGAEDYLGDQNTICVIEWPEKLKKLLKNKKTINVTIEHTENERLIKIED